MCEFCAAVAWAGVFNGSHDLTLENLPSLAGVLEEYLHAYCNDLMNQLKQLETCELSQHIGSNIFITQ